jgi:putative hydrolase of the HAD superfamily
MLTHVIFDLDDTLYPQDCGLWPAIGQRINLYMVERLGMAPEEAARRRLAYLREFGTTLNGLRCDFNIEAADYLDFAHDLRLEDYLQPDPQLDAMLAALPQRKAIFTNADANHAGRVLNRLGIARHFEAVMDIFKLGLVNKPRPEAYRALLDSLGARAAECVLVEDSLANLAPARALGMRTIWIHSHNHSDEADHVIRRVHEVADIVRRLG